MSQLIEYLKKFLVFDKKRPSCWLSRIIFITFILIILYFTTKLAPYLLGISLLIFAFAGDNIQKLFQNPAPVNYEYEYMTVRDALFIALRECSDLVGCKQPEDVSNLLPPNLQCIQFITNVPYCHFVILKKESGKQLNYADSIHILQDVMIQHLASFKIPNIPLPYYGNLPALYVVNMGDDLENSNYICIDIVYNNNDQKSSFIQERERRLLNNNVSSNSIQKEDKDF